MAIDIVLGTPLADAVQAAIKPKLLEVGWGTGGPDDEALAEYVVLMLVNGRTQSQIAAELSGELFNLGPDDPNAREFSTWLFDEVDRQATEHHPRPQSAAASDPISAASEDSATIVIDTEMQPTAEHEVAPPTGPRSMRYSNPRAGRDKRLLGHLHRAMDRTAPDAPLHRVRAHTGNERISSHSRPPPNGNRFMQAGRGARPGGMRVVGAAASLAAPAAMNALHGPTMNGMPMQDMQPMGISGHSSMTGGDGFNGLNGTIGTNGAAGYNVVNGINGVDGMKGMNGNNGNNGNNAQQWMMQGHVVPPSPLDIYALFEQQSRMMQQLSQQVMNNTRVAPQQRPGKSLFDRVQNPHKNHHHRRTSDASRRSPDPGSNGERSKDVDMTTDPSPREPPNPDETMCKFNRSCTNKDCKFAHSSPAAPAHTSVDVSDVCSFGAACKNRKCVARHPSPASRVAHQIEQDCKFFPNCQNVRCPFRHPTMPLCRNGGDCSNSACKFTHIKTRCKYSPCLNQHCPFAHDEGQRGLFKDKVWKPDSTDHHVSDRKFVKADADEDEEVITMEANPVRIKHEELAVAGSLGVAVGD